MTKEIIIVCMSDCVLFRQCSKQHKRCVWERWFILLWSVFILKESYKGGGFSNNTIHNIMHLKNENTIHLDEWHSVRDLIRVDVSFWVYILFWSREHFISGLNVSHRAAWCRPFKNMAAALRLGGWTGKRVMEVVGALVGESTEEWLLTPPGEEKERGEVVWAISGWDLSGKIGNPWQIAVNVYMVHLSQTQ